ncbi:MAG TPA: Gfo/Idh/MocA family oxidoreductase [Phototrophicaceae bacterium]|nr:Gfo/Idh/MocA family oxidoreductase [Phototrophicaceae bacterium]
MEPKIKIAVIGTGWWSTTAHIPGLLEYKQADIILIDPNAQALQAAAQHYGLRKTYASLKDALAAHPDIKGAIVAVPHRFHAEIGREVLESGLHLLIEKPMTLYAKDARRLVELADERNLHLMVGYFYPHTELFKEARKRIDDGLVGDVEYITCSMTSLTIELYRGKPEAYDANMPYPVTRPGKNTYSDPAISGGGQGHLQATHSTGLMFALAPGLRAEVVTAFMNPLDTRVDVADACAVRMNNGAVATVGSTGNITAGDHGMLEVHLHGSRGRLRIDLSAGEFYMRQHSGQGERVEINGSPDLGRRSSQRFADLILGKITNPAPGRDVGLYSVELLDAAYRSAGQGGMPVTTASLYGD